MIDLCSAILFEKSRRELSIDVAEHWSVLENYQNTNNPLVIVLRPKQL